MRDPHVQKDVINRFAGLHGPAMIAWADRLIRLLHIHDAGLAPEDPVEGALLKLWQAVGQGTIELSGTVDDFLRAFHLALRQFLLGERRRQRARRRGGPEEAPHETVDLDSIASHSPPPDMQLSGQEEVESRLARLDLQDPSLREIAVSRMEHYTNRDIAAALKRSSRTIEDKLREIRSILAPGFPNRGSRRDPPTVT
jgi:DNA-directed RNA polymerase specialized sigma24 family protein